MSFPSHSSTFSLLLALCTSAYLANSSPAAEEDSPPPPVSIVREDTVHPGPTTSPDGKWTLLAKDNTAQLIDAATRIPAGPELSHGDSRRPAKRILIWTFSPCGKYLATAFSADTHGGDDTAGDVRVWEVPSGAPVTGRPWSTTGYVRALRFSPDSRTLLIQSDEQSGK